MTDLEKLIAQNTQALEDAADALIAASHRLETEISLSTEQLIVTIEKLRDRLESFERGVTNL